MTKYREWMFIGVCVLICAVLYSYRLGFPAKEYFDEVYFVPSARQYLAHSPTIMDTAHPPLGKLMIAATMGVLGDKPWIWRLMSLLSGLALIPVVFFLTKKILRDFKLACLVTVLFSIEGMHLTQSRIAMLNAPMLLFMMLSLLALVPFFEDKSHPRTRAFLGAGVCFGIAISIRWVAVYFLAIIGIFLIKSFIESREKWLFLRDILVFMLGVPVLIYIAAHLTIPLMQGYPWIEIWRSQVQMFRYHSALRETHTYGSPWWSWPVLIRPIWYYFERNNGTVNGILCIGNPALYWSIPFAMAYVLFKFVKERCFRYGFILLGFFIPWLPWMLVSRVKFFHYFYPCIPFAMMAIALVIQEFWQTGKMGRWIVIGYLLAVALLFIYWYPLYVGIPISNDYFSHHMWFRSWI